MTDFIQKIGGGTLTNASQLIINNFTADYIKYEIIFSGLSIASGSQVNFVLRTSTDNGANFTNSANSYTHIMQHAGAGSSNVVYYNGLDTEAQIVRAVSSTANDFVSGTLEIFDPMDATKRTTFVTRAGGRINADSVSTLPIVQCMTSQREASEANNGIRIFVDSGSNFSMQYTIYAYKAGSPGVSLPQGLGTTDSPQFAGLNVGNASDTTITRVGPGDIGVEGNTIYRSGGLTVNVANGGTDKTSFNPYAVITSGVASQSALVSQPIATGQTIIGVGGSIQNIQTAPALALPGIGRIPGRNLLRNGDFSVFQRAQGVAMTINGATFGARGYQMSVPASSSGYIMDRWQLLTGGSQACTAWVAENGSNAPSSIFVNHTGHTAAIQRNSGQTGTGTIKLCQTIPMQDLPIRLENQPIVLTFSTFIGPNFSADSNNITATVYYGTGSTDESGISGGLTSGGTIFTVTESAWNGSSGFAAGVFHVIRGSTPSALSQLAVEIAWTPTGTAGGSDVLYISNVQLEIGENPTIFDQKSYQQNLIECLPFYRKSFGYRVQPAQNIGSGKGEHIWPASRAGALSNTSSRIYLGSMYGGSGTAPTITLYNPAGANAQAYDNQAAGDCSSTTATNVTNEGFNIATTGNSSTLVGNELAVHWTAESEITA